MIIDNRVAPGPSGDHPRDYFTPSRFDLHSIFSEKKKVDIESKSLFLDAQYLLS